MRAADEVRPAWRDFDRMPPFIRSLAVRFDPAPGDRGTEVHLRNEDRSAHATIRECLRAFKQELEAGEVATNDRQPRGSCVRGRTQ